MEIVVLVMRKLFLLSRNKFWMNLCLDKPGFVLEKPLEMNLVLSGGFLFCQFSNPSLLWDLCILIWRQWFLLSSSCGSCGSGRNEKFCSLMSSFVWLPRDHSGNYQDPALAQSLQSIDQETCRTHEILIRNGTIGVNGRQSVQHLPSLILPSLTSSAKKEDASAVYLL